MRFFVRKRRTTPAVIIVALIDVLIVLLIFLLVTTTFKQQAALRLTLPESSQARKEGATENPPLIVSIEGVDRGYMEIYRAAKDSIARCYDSQPHDLGLHGAIADAELVNRGLGPLVLREVIASILVKDPACQRIMFDPDHRNATVRRLCEFLGCEFLGEHDMSNRRIALYALECAAVR